MLKVNFWGARGSVPASGPGFVRHGGATTCLEILPASPTGQTPERLIVDCGTGLVELGKNWGERDLEAIVLQTHFHWDHIQGFPFFGPLFSPSARFELMAAEREGCSFEDVLRRQMSQPTFPVGLDVMPSELDFRSIPRQGQEQRGELQIQWREVDHPSGCTAWRLDYRGASVVFSGDLEVQAGCAEALIDLSRGADVLIMDAQYMPEEYAARRGFGHSTPLDAVEVAEAAGVGHLLMTHHDPTHTDDTLDRKLALARSAASGELTVDNAAEGRGLHVTPTRCWSVEGVSPVASL